MVELNIGGTPWIESANSLIGRNYAAHLRSKDLVPTLRLDVCRHEDCDSNWMRFARCIDHPLEDIGLLSVNATSKQLNLLLSGLDGRVTPTCSLLIDGFRVSGDQFRRLTAQFEHLLFVRCHFGRGWWQSGSDRKCQTLSLESCTGTFPGRTDVGGAGWSALSFLGIHGPGRSIPLRTSGIWPEYPANRELTEPFARAAVAALWGDSLDNVCVNDLDSIEFLTSLPSLKTLESMSLASPVSPGILEWVGGNPNLKSLDLAWIPGVSLPWSELRRLKRLRYLDVTDSPFDDADLRDLIRNTKLRTLRAYYANLTPASWPAILSWPSLRSFWASMEMSGDEEPEGMPETTQLKEFVALNALTAWFERLLSRYPNVKIDSM
ncbi:MAG: hypothetical protein ACOYON_07000 [Fimbriimonas sp.]